MEQEDAHLCAEGDLAGGGVFIIAWAADGQGYVLLNSDFMVVHGVHDGRVRRQRFSWDQVVLEDHLWRGREVVVILRIGRHPGRKLILSLDGHRGGADALAYILGRTRG